MKNVEQTIISQYGNSAAISALIYGMNENIQPDTNIDDFYNFVFNVETAQGFGLDIWGRIVNISRAVFTNPVTYLSDDAFRSLILLKALSNISYASAPSINQLLQNWLADPGARAYVIDTGNMTMEYVFEFALTGVQFEIIKNSNIFLRPAGVRATIVQLAGPYIGFAEQGLPFVTTMGSGIFSEGE